MKKITLIALASLVTLTGCEKESEQKPASFYNQKNTTVYSYEQSKQKMDYQNCLAQHRENNTEGECHVPDFLKK